MGNYYITKYGNKINSDRVLIPMEEGNQLYEQYITYLVNGGTVYETDLLSDEEIEQERLDTIPKTISKMKFFLELLNTGITRQMIYDEIAKIQDQTTKETFLIKLEYSQEFDRYDEHLNILAQQFGITQQQLDQLFINANK